MSIRVYDNIAAGPVGSSSTESHVVASAVAASENRTDAIGYGMKPQRKKYIIRDRLYELTNEELAYMIARELIDYTREDIKVTYKNKKPHLIAKKAYESLMETVKRIDAFKIIPPDVVLVDDESDDEEAVLLLL